MASHDDHCDTLDAAVRIDSHNGPEPACGQRSLPERSVHRFTTVGPGDD
jgi:hypothetical protein